MVKLTRSQLQEKLERSASKHISVAAARKPMKLRQPFLCDKALSHYLQLCAGRSDGTIKNVTADRGEFSFLG